MGKTCSNWRERQADREALMTLAAYVVYFLWWYGFAYGLGEGDPEQYSYVLGLPAWFFYSCIVGYLVLSLLLWLMIRFFFHDMPLDEAGTEDITAEEDGKNAAQNMEAADAQISEGE